MNTHTKNTLFIVAIICFSLYFYSDLNYVLQVIVLSNNKQINNGLFWNTKFWF